MSSNIKGAVGNESNFFARKSRDQQIERLKQPAVGLDRPDAQDDREWFEKNPARKYRIRMPSKGEPALMQCSVPSPLDRVIVKQISPGSRQRVYIRLNEGVVAENTDKWIMKNLL